MKQETKELIEWIKRHISVTANEDAELHHKAFDFLNSLPEIESHLCRGGYIQDQNGTPCCHGDKVMYKSKEYILQWSQPYSKFYLKTDKSVSGVWTFSINEILKVEE